MEWPGLGYFPTWNHHHRRNTWHQGFQGPRHRATKSHEAREVVTEEPWAAVIQSFHASAQGHPAEPGGPPRLRILRIQGDQGSNSSCHVPVRIELHTDPRETQNPCIRRRAQVRNWICGWKPFHTNKSRPKWQPGGFHPIVKAELVVILHKIFHKIEKSNSQVILWDYVETQHSKN